MKRIWLFLVPIVFLFVAAINEGDRSFDTGEYFLILRIVVSICCVIIAVQAHDIVKPCNKEKYYRCLLILEFIAIVFNPIIPFIPYNFPRNMWRIAYIIAGIAFIVCGFLTNWLGEKTSPICESNDKPLINMREELDS